MPLLQPEQTMYPEDLFDAAEPHQSAVPWWVLHTRPRAEKQLARTLLRRRVGFFLPTYQRQWSHRGRMRTSCLPLFPGYLFLRGNNADRIAALETNLIVNCLEVKDQALLRADLVQVHRLIATGAPLSPEDRLEPGDWVEIIDGSLVGLEGRIIERGSGFRLFVEVRMLNRGVSVEIDRATVRPAAMNRVPSRPS